MSFNFINIEIPNLGPLIQPIKSNWELALVVTAIILMPAFSYWRKLITEKFIEKKPPNAKDQLIKEIICYNQGKVAEVQYISANLHKFLRVSLADYKENPQEEKKENIAKIVEGLEGYLATEIAKIARKNFNYIQEHYKHRHPVKPRICLKSNYISNQGSEQVEQIFPIARCDMSANTASVGCRLEENTGFHYIKKTGRFFVEGNIPKKCTDPENPYKNPRINLPAAKNYRKNYALAFLNLFLPNITWRVLSFLPDYMSDKKWETCWNRSAGEPRSDEDSYKSTLIIPLTFWNNPELCQDFLTGLDLFEEDNLHNGKARAILGYLCFDHADTNYFNTASDVSMGYIVADMLCLYMAVLSNYTRTSQTYSEAVQLVTE